jgi:hypothetical protein
MPQSMGHQVIHFFSEDSQDATIYDLANDSTSVPLHLTAQQALYGLPMPQSMGHQVIHFFSEDSQDATIYDLANDSTSVPDQW